MLVDRQAPFGNEFLLPRGTLREPPRNLRRASYIFITKNTGESNDALVQAHPPLQSHRRDHRVRASAALSAKYFDRRTIAAGAFARHFHWVDLRHRRAGELRRRACKKLGARIELAKRYIDHHYYTEAELQSFINRCIRRDLEMIVTTEKDAVRMPRLPEAEVKVPIYFLRVEIEILSGHESWEHCVARICKPQPHAFAGTLLRLKNFRHR